MDQKTAERIAAAMERIATAQETSALIFQVLLAEEGESASTPPKTIMTHAGLVELG